MARPKLLRPSDGGEILLRNCTPETVERVKIALETSNEATVVAEPYEVETPAPTPVPITTAPGLLTETSIGIYQDSTTLSHYVAQVKYNPYTKTALVTKVENCGSPDVAAERFKITAVKLNLV